MKALIVVDMLNDFVEKKGVLSFPQARAIIAFIKKRIEVYRKNGDPIAYLQDWHKKDDKEFDRFPEHALEDTWGSEIITELKPMVKSGSILERVVRKTRYSGFFDTELEFLLRVWGIDEVEVVGVCTSICVMDTVGGLVDRDYGVIVPEAGVADFDFNNHHNALARMEVLYGAKVIPE